MLHQLGCMLYSPPLESHIRQLKPIPSGSKWEIELRGTSIWCVELIRQYILRQHPEAADAMFEHYDSDREQRSSENVTEFQSNSFFHNEAETQDTNGEPLSSEVTTISGQLNTEPVDSHDDREELVKSLKLEINQEAETETGTAHHESKPNIDHVITKDHSPKGEPKCGINAILIDFFLYDTIKQLESGGQESIPHHRTRSIWY
jgi:hypothetical protein